MNYRQVHLDFHTSEKIENIREISLNRIYPERRIMLKEQRF
jgi:hypothetical protein